MPLTAPMEAYQVVVNLDEIDVGLLEDLQSDQVKELLRALTRVIAESNLPHGHDHDGLRRLKPEQIKPVAQAVVRAMELPKAT
jgi:hypothetical protein